MKAIWIAITLLFLMLVVVAVLFMAKFGSIERRIEGIPDSASMDKRFLAIEESVELIQKDRYSMNKRIHERLTALETGQAKPVTPGAETVEYLITSLKQDFLNREEMSYTDPDTEPIFSERMEQAIAKLADKAAAGQDIVAPLMTSLATSTDPGWKSYLLRDVIWNMGPGAKEALMEFFDDRGNEAGLRAVTAEAVMKIGDRPELEHFAEALSDPDEELLVKTALAVLFYTHPISDAEPGLIEGVEGRLDPETRKRIPYAPQHRFACLRALESHDSARTIQFLEDYLYRSCEPGSVEMRNSPQAVNHALHAYARIQRGEAAALFKILNDQFDLPEDMVETMHNYLKQYSTENGAGGESDANGENGNE